MPTHLRIAQVDDIPAIEAVIRESVLVLQTEYTRVQRELALQTVFTIDTQLILDGTYFVMVDEETGALAGCGGWSFRGTLYGGDHQVERKDSGRLDPATDAAKVRAIFVAPAFARRGFGSTLLEAAERAAREAGFHRVEMGSTLAGVPLYSLRGWLESDRVRVPVGEGESIAVVRMSKNLAGPAGDV